MQLRFNRGIDPVKITVYAAGVNDGNPVVFEGFISVGSIQLPIRTYGTYRIERIDVEDADGAIRSFTHDDLFGSDFVVGSAEGPVGGEGCGSAE
jgi:hypothetical protein